MRAIDRAVLNFQTSRHRIKNKKESFRIPPQKTQSKRNLNSKSTHKLKLNVKNCFYLFYVFFRREETKKRLKISI